MKLVIYFLLFICLTTYIIFYIYKYDKYLCKSNYDYPFQDPTLPIDTRLDNLMSLLTPEEKVRIRILIHINYYLFKIDMLWMDGETSGIIFIEFHN